MAPRRTNANELPLNDWEELRNTLRDMQVNFQTTIQNAVREITDAVVQQQHDRDRRRVLFDDESTDVEDNPFAEDELRQDRRMNLPNRDHVDRSWEIGFKVEIPEFHGGVRGEELLDWLVAVQEVLEFKRVPEERRLHWSQQNLEARRPRGGCKSKQPELVRVSRTSTHGVSWKRCFAKRSYHTTLTARCTTDSRTCVKDLGVLMIMRRNSLYY